jgi:hypothetical protein
LHMSPHLVDCRARPAAPPDPLTLTDDG